MKKLLFLFAPVALFFSCNTEFSAEQYRAQTEKQCLKQISTKFLDDTATDEDKEKFCDCYFDYMLGDAEMVTAGEMMKKNTKIEELQTAMEACKTEINEPTIVEEVIEGAEGVIEDLKEVVE